MSMDDGRAYVTMPVKSLSLAADTHEQSQGES
jgi:hypothetical protein